MKLQQILINPTRRKLFRTAAVVGLLVSSATAGGSSAIKDIPRIAEDRSSKSYLAEKIAADTKRAARIDVEAEDYDKYADALAEVLATFTPQQQLKIFYGK